MENNPNLSAPSERERNILKQKEITRVITEKTVIISAVFLVELIRTSLVKYMRAIAYIYLMILRLEVGERIAYKAKQCGVSEQEIEKYNGFLPEEGEYFVVPSVQGKYIVSATDTLFSVSKKTGLTPVEIQNRVVIFCAGKEFYY